MRRFRPRPNERRRRSSNSQGPCIQRLPRPQRHPRICFAPSNLHDCRCQNTSNAEFVCTPQAPQLSQQVSAHTVPNQPLQAQLCGSGPHDLDKEYALLFAVVADTAPGSEVVLLGELPEFGGWQPDQCVALQTSPAQYPLWTAKVSGCRLSGTVTQFKFAIRQQDEGKIIWESGRNRKIVLGSSGWVLCHFDDWSVQSSAWMRPIKPVPASGSMVLWEAHCPDTKPGDELLVVGSCPELGAWVPSKGLRLSTRPHLFPKWRGATRFPPMSEEVILWKFVILRADGNVEWEVGRDRRLVLPSAGDAVEVCMLHGKFQNMFEQPLPQRLVVHATTTQVPHRPESRKAAIAENNDAKVVPTFLHGAPAVQVPRVEGVDNCTSPRRESHALSRTIPHSVMLELAAVHLRGLGMILARGTGTMQVVAHTKAQQKMQHENCSSSGQLTHGECYRLPVQSGDLLLLFSQGFAESLRTSQIMQLVNRAVSKLGRGDLATPASLTQALMAAVKSKDSHQSSIIVAASWVKTDGTKVYLEDPGLSAAQASADEVQAVISAIESMDSEKANASPSAHPVSKVKNMQAPMDVSQKKGIMSGAFADNGDSTQPPEDLGGHNEGQTLFGLAPACITRSVPERTVKLVSSIQYDRLRQGRFIDSNVRDPDSDDIAAYQEIADLLSADNHTANDTLIAMVFKEVSPIHEYDAYDDPAYREGRHTAPTHGCLQDGP